MKKMFLRSAVVALAGVGLMTGSAFALTLDYGTPLLLIDGNGDNDVTVTLGIMNTLFDDYSLLYSVNGGTSWVDPLFNNVAFPTLDGGTVLDLALEDSSGTIYSLSGDKADDSYSVSMDFSGLIDASYSANPVVEYDYWTNVTTTWTFVNPAGSSDTVTFALSSPYDGVAPVPEPATMLLFGTGLAGLAGVVRRKKVK